MSFLTLGIESSCDDTAIAILRGENTVLASKIAAQDHAAHGGVVPELASRKHQEAIIELISQTLKEAEIDAPSVQLSLVAVTAGPGLIGSLLVGVMTACGLAQGWGLPIIPVNHIEGHIYAPFSAHSDIRPPFLSLVASGGHTEIYHVKAFGDYELLGATKDDAVGEAYDKTAKLLGLGYPGGPAIDALAQSGNENAFNFPVPMKDSKEIAFSFSGLKTAVLLTLKKNKDVNIPDICASFQKAAVSSLVTKALLASKKTGARALTMSGGVAANSALRHQMRSMCEKNNIKLYAPPINLCTDNAVMIAAAGYAAYHRGVKNNKFNNKNNKFFGANPSWELWDD